MSPRASFYSEALVAHLTAPCVIDDWKFVAKQLKCPETGVDNTPIKLQLNPEAQRASRDRANAFVHQSEHWHSSLIPIRMYCQSDGVV